MEISADVVEMDRGLELGRGSGILRESEGKVERSCPVGHDPVHAL